MNCPTSRSSVSALAFVLLFGAMTGCSGGGGSAAAASSGFIAGGPSQIVAVAPSTAPALPTVPAPALSPTGTAAGEIPLSADSLSGDRDATNNFIDSIGVNTRFDVNGSVYANFAAVKAALVNLGVRHIRDNFSIGNPSGYETKLADLAHSGIHSDLVLTIREDSNNNARINVSGAQACAYLQAGHYAESIEAVEGINEPDVNQGVSTGPVPNGWVAITQSAQKDLFSGVQALTPRAKRLFVYGPSVARVGHVLQVGDLAAYMDYGNVHNYSGGSDSTPASIVSALASEAAISGNKPVIASENGFSTGTTGQGMPDAIMLDYAQRLFFKQFAGNVKRTVWYEFADEDAIPNDYWKNSGLINSSYAPKPAYVGLKNVIALLQDQTPYTRRTPLNFAFGEQTPSENLVHLLLQKNDGSYWLAVWNNVSEWTPVADGMPGSYAVPRPAPQINSITFAGTYVASMIEYDEDASGASTSRAVPLVSGRMVHVPIGARPTIFKIVLGAAPVMPIAPAVAHPAAHWSFDEGSGPLAVDSVDPAGGLTIPSDSKVAWLTGKYNSALMFSGTQAQTSNVFIDTSRDYSATAWVELNALDGFQAALAINGRNQAAFALDFTPQSNLSYSTYAGDSAGGVTRIGSTIVPVVGTWYAVAATFNGTSRKMSFYVNGRLQGSATAPHVFKATGGTEVGSMLAAGVGHFQWWNGGIDEVNLYQRELTPAEVAAMAGF